MAHEIRVGNPTGQMQELPVPGRPKILPGAEHPDWTPISPALERTLAQGRFVVVDRRDATSLEVDEVETSGEETEAPESRPKAGRRSGARKDR